MNNFYKLLFLFLIVITGCKNTDLNDKNTTQIIDSFKMNIYSDNGEKIFTVNSPFTSYENKSNIFNMRETTIYLFKNNETEYEINSDKSKLSNNKLLELNGNVIVKSKLQQGDKLYANSFIWNIHNSEYLLLGDVKFENTSITLSSNKATLNKASNIIKFFNPVKYKIKDTKNKGNYEINSENAYYDIDTKSVSFRSDKKRVRSKIYF